MEALLSINPFTQEKISEYLQDTPEDIQQIVTDSHLSFKKWSQKSHLERCSLSAELAKVLSEKKQDLALLITSEMGKPLRESLAEIEKCVWLCKHYSIVESSHLPNETISTDAKEVNLSYEPLGVLFAIMPWNFPFWQVFRFSVPTITSGNTVILKHAPNVTGCSKAIEQLFVEAGYPSEVFHSVVIQADRSEEIIQHSFVRGVTLTGSEQAGRAVASLAGKHLKKSVLELGGSDPFIVFQDADFLNSCTTGMISRMMNAGQVCIAAKRFIVHSSVYETFIAFQSEALLALKAGDPLDLSTDLGTMARPDLVDKIEEQVSTSVSMGAKVLCGGHRHPDHPLIYLPTLLTDVRPGMPVYEEETFGPVMIVLPFNTDDEAIALANDTRFGLGVSIWTKDLEKARKIMPFLEAGAVFVNSLVKSDPRVPFGGIKNSGYGKELAHAGIKEFMNLKINWIA